MTNVIHIMSSYGGGISSFIKNKAIALENTDIIFDVVAFNDCPESFINIIQNTGGNVYKVPNPKKEGFINFFKQCHQIFKTKPKDTLVHSHIQGYRAWPFCLVAKYDQIDRFAVHAHTGYDDSRRKTLSGKTTKLVNQIIADEKISCGRKASIASFGSNDFDNKKIMHIPNSISASDYFSDQVNNNIDDSILKEKLYGVEHKNKLIIGHVGRFHPVKNHKFIIRLVEKISLVNPDFLMVLVGEGELKEEIKNEVLERHLEKFVRFMGRRNDLPKLYKSFDQLILPSFYEGLPTVAIEAQASGTPVLLSNTITQESDLGLGLVKFLPLEDLNEWAKNILIKDTKIPSTTQIKKIIKKKNFTNDTSAQLYKQYINGQIFHYEI